MRRLIGALVILLAVLAWHSEAEAACYSETITTPDGRIIICWVCCSGSLCNTSCF